MAQIFPTKGNLIATKKSLDLAKTGFELMDRKRNILVRETMSMLDTAKEILQRTKFERMTSNTLLSVEEVLQQLSVIRKCGYAVDNEELEYGLVCLGVAIMDSNNKPVGGISVSGPASRMTPENRTAFAEYLIDCGRQISSKL